MEKFPCACSFGKAVKDRDPHNFPRVGMADTVMYRGGWIVRHVLTGREAIIRRPNEAPLHAEADKCCFAWFDHAKGKN